LIIFLWKILPNFPDLAGGIPVDNLKQPIFWGCPLYVDIFFHMKILRQGQAFFIFFQIFPRTSCGMGKVENTFPQPVDNFVEKFKENGG